MCIRDRLRTYALNATPLSDAPWRGRLHHGARVALRRLTNGLKGTRYLPLDRLAGVGSDLGRERPNLAGLAREHIELAADEAGLKLDDLCEVLGARQALGEVETGIEIALGDVDELAVEGGRALARGIEGALKRIDRLFERFLAAFIGLAGLVHGLLGKRADTLGDGLVDLGSIELR